MSLWSMPPNHNISEVIIWDVHSMSDKTVCTSQKHGCIKFSRERGGAIFYLRSNCCCCCCASSLHNLPILQLDPPHHLPLDTHDITNRSWQLTAWQTNVFSKTLNRRYVFPIPNIESVILKNLLRSYNITGYSGNRIKNQQYGLHYRGCIIG